MIGYRAALDWIILNDDIEWLEDEDGVISVTAVMVADIYNKNPDKVVTDLKK